MTNTVVTIAFVLLMGCATSPVKRYQATIAPHLNRSKKADMEKLFGRPVWCRQEEILEHCQYRTTYHHNDPVPDAYRKQGAFGPDLSPYEYFDELDLFYDDTGVLRRWEPGGK